MKDFTRVCRIEPQAVGAWLKQTSVKSNFQHVIYTIFFRRKQLVTNNDCPSIQKLNLFTKLKAFKENMVVFP
jgi:hypothetical protein